MNDIDGVYIRTSSTSVQTLDITFREPEHTVIPVNAIRADNIRPTVITKDQINSDLAKHIQFSHKEFNPMSNNKFKKIGPLYKGVRFAADNAADVVEYLREKGFEVRSGGNWIRVQTPYSPAQPHVVLTRGTWALIEQITGELKTVADDVFEQDFKLSGRRSKDPSYLKIAPNVEAIQLDGNPSEVAEFARERGRVARAGNGWVKFSERTAKTTDWVIWYPEVGGLAVMSDDEFQTTYAPTR